MSAEYDMMVEDILGHLIAFPTICERSNEALIDWVESFLLALGARCERVPGAHTGRFNLLASIGPETPDGVILSAHSDVVPVEGQPWTTDPFHLTKHDNRLYGRGTSDMKGFLACMLVAARTAAALPDLKAPLHLVVSCDEEIGCVGVRSLLKELATRKFRARGSIIGEPTGLHVVSGHKGKLAARVICRGLAAHSANPDRGCNAILLAADVIGSIRALQQELLEKGVQDDAYEVPYSTMQVGLIQGGTALNIVPDYCELGFEMRFLPGVDPESWLDRLRQEAARLCDSIEHARVEVEVVNSYPGLHAPDNITFLRNIMQITGDNATGRIGFGTEGGLFSEYLDIPVVICGPGSIDRAHKADEFILDTELAAGVQFVSRVVEGLL
ncbi:acetylornithine deacetylase [Acetobacter oeni]|uniref:Acetylornithine deacetylase n=1 Tax=Acetobacter oeni TaxID=304077 RepID=A0A511XQG6_9PROT|nr:acetylornithine deacetylase [Acetobacter oeni]MBB3884832.1 acetylornithine deacetylase [Acetobacter oeni]NHO20768.1 acetylornithine deacetylase [Acetobacter oeni]GBR03413.1 acetylornithine deacetylase ArgE [Acetobacter oeni LMG 21952]GEN65210.1 acetylornithine deacetylase [Acetobacter oeni]